MLGFGSILKRCRKLMIGDKINCMYHLKTECPRNLLRYVAVVLASIPEPGASCKLICLTIPLQSYQN